MVNAKIVSDMRSASLIHNAGYNAAMTAATSPMRSERISRPAAPTNHTVPAPSNAVASRCTSVLVPPNSENALR